MPKHRSKDRPKSLVVSHGLRCRYVRVGQGFGGFFDLREKIFFLKICPGAVLPPQVEFFMFLDIKSNRVQRHNDGVYSSVCVFLFFVISLL